MNQATTRPRVLYLTHHLPWPARSGGRLREVEILRRLTTRFDIEVVAVSKVPQSDQAALSEAAACGVTARVFPAESGSRWAGPLTRNHSSQAAREYLASALRSAPAVVHLEGHYLLPLLPSEARSRAVLVEHNVESDLFLQRAQAAGISPAALRPLIHTLQTRLTERRAWRSVALTGAVTHDDAQLMQEQGAPRVAVLPNGCDHLMHSPASGSPALPPHRPDLLYVGNFAYQPNQDAAHWLVSEIFPRITATIPDATLAVVGPNPPDWLAREAAREPRLHVPGFVPELMPWIDAAKVVVCPLRVGGGVKVKVLEALACGKVLVTTPVGGQGLGHLPIDAFRSCSDTASVAAACSEFLSSPVLRAEQQQRAQAAARRLPTWDSAADDLAALWEKAMVSHPRTAETV